MSLWELLACPVCGGDVALDAAGQRVACAGCGRIYPVRDGVPIMLEDPARALTAHQGELPARPGYSRWKERIILKSLTGAQAALDFGAGRQALDDPRIIRMDLIFDPRLDVVGDVHALPFKPDALDFVFGGAVMEHLVRPGRAVEEMYRVLKPGGYVYADWNFVVAYHGYPHHYFNATLHGVDEVFARFTPLDRGVAPFHGPAFALRCVLCSYLEIFKPDSRLEHEFADLLHRVLWHPLDDFDRRIDPGDRHRVAASIYFYGLKQPTGREHLLPEPVVRIYESTPALRERFPTLLDLSVPENVMLWAKSEGSQQHPALADYFATLPRFSKRGVAPTTPSEIDTWPAELLDHPDPGPGEAARQYSLFFSRSLPARLAQSWDDAGLPGVARCIWESSKRRGKIIWQRLRRSMR